MARPETPTNADMQSGVVMIAFRHDRGREANMSDTGAGAATAAIRKTARRTPTERRRAMAQAAVTVALGALIGVILFQGSALAFDYMKLRNIPLYDSAISLRMFARDLFVARSALETQNGGLIRASAGDAAIQDLRLLKRKLAADRAISVAKTSIRAALDDKQVAESGFNNAGMSFNAVDAVFTKYCPTVGAAATPTGQAFGDACKLSLNGCDGDLSTLNARSRMICAQIQYQEAVQEKEAMAAFQYDGAGALVGALAVAYPDIDKTKVSTAILVVDAYHALVPCPDAVKSATYAGVGASGETKPARCGVVSRVWTELWSFVLSQPLAINYLVLALLFGAMGNLVRYLYRFAQPEAGTDPEEGPLMNALAGGGGAIMVLVIVMAGFQFLTVGASAPDLAYPNPLTVAAISVLAGLGGERVLAALNSFIGRLFGPPPSDSAGGAAADPPPADDPAQPVSPPPPASPPASPPPAVPAAPPTPSPG